MARDEAGGTRDTATIRAIAEVSPIILDAYDPCDVLTRAALALRALPPGATLAAVTIGAPLDGDALVREMEEAERACPPPLRLLAAARRGYYRRELRGSYAPDVRHFLRLEDTDPGRLAQTRGELEATLGLDLRWLNADDPADAVAWALCAPVDAADEDPTGVHDREGRRWAARTIDRLPAHVSLGWLRPVLALRFPYRVSLVIEGRDQWAELMRLTGKVTALGHIAAAAADARQEGSRAELARVMTEVDRGLTTVVRVGLSVATGVEHGEDDLLRRRLRDVDGALRSILGATGLRAGDGDHARLVADDPPLYRTTHEVAAAAFPWQRAAPGHATGVILGEAGGTIVRYDFSKAMTGLMAIVGVQGSGKSMAGQFIALQRLLRGDPLTIVDSSGSWRALVDAAGGLIWRLAEGVTCPWTEEETLGASAVLLDTAGLPAGTEAAAYALCRDVMLERTAAAHARGVNALACVDEGWGFIKHAGGLVQEVGRKARHLDMHMILLTQNLSDALDDPDGVRFFTAIPAVLLMRTVDERLGQGAGLGWMGRVFGFDEDVARGLGTLRRLSGPTGFSEAYFIERDPTRSVLQRGKIRVRLTPYDLALMGSYRFEREERARLVALHGSLVKAVIASVAPVSGATS